MGDTIDFIDWNSLKTTDPENARIVDCRHVASFNWLNKKMPTIVIPGKLVSGRFILIYMLTIHRDATSVDPSFQAYFSRRRS